MENPFELIDKKLDELLALIKLMREQPKHLGKNFDKPMSVDEASEYLNIAKGTIYGLTSKRLIPHFKRGKKLVFLKADLDQWLLSQRMKTVDEIIKDW